MFEVARRRNEHEAMESFAESLYVEHFEGVVESNFGAMQRNETVDVGESEALCAPIRSSQSRRGT